MSERLDIPGFDGYQASDDGQIWNRRTGRALRQRQAHARGGMMQVDIGKTTRMVHDLIARTFFGICPPGYRIKHRNGDPSNNRKDNLAWAGSPKAADPSSQPRVLPSALEDEYDRVRCERLALVELMQT